MKKFFVFAQFETTEGIVAVLTLGETNTLALAKQLSENPQWSPLYNNVLTYFNSRRITNMVSVEIKEEK